MRIRRLQSSDAERLKGIRMRALRDAPYAFGSSFAQEKEFPPEHWSRLVSSETEGVFVAEEEDRWLGLAGVGVDWEDSAGGFIWGMWTEPEARGGGVGAALLDRCLQWVRDKGLRRARLWVTDTNDPARLLYESRGFKPTGVTKPHPPDPRLTEQEMELTFGD